MVLTAVAIVSAQTTQATGGSQTGSNPAVPVPLPVETGTTNPDLAFKPPVEKETLPPAQAPARPEAAPSKGPAVVAPVPIEGGPKVLEDLGLPANPPPGTHTVAPLPARGVPAIKQGKPYVLGPLDVVEVRVWNDPKLSGIFDVGTDGTISLPLIGATMASGLTAAELNAVIRQKLTTVIIEPEVNVQVLRNNSKKYSILGGCVRQGEFPLAGDVTVLDALANCGGFKDFANLKKIYVLRGVQQLKFNYRDAIKGKHPEQNISLESGDRIIIPE